ncbi:ATP-binding protein [Streptomyces sp. NPDC057020]|uniref:ATP-binding protein n=1 Tax=unclassified Streptomyces TaxID=2593676 RepID=UPI00363BD7D6
MLDVDSARPEFYLSGSDTEQSRVLPCAPQSAAVARRLVTAVLRHWELPELTDRATVVVSELVTNAVIHAKTNGASVRVIISRLATGRVQVAVTDLDRRPPEPLEQPDSAREGGRGLALVASLSESWGTDPRHWGKSVWAELAA